MGKPRMIILIRHAQSEGNQNRAIHQTVPDHRVKLTEHGREQAREAGRRLRKMLRPDDTLQFYTSPYRRTRETTEGILSTLTSDEESPTPFPRHTIKVWEEPRLREQDFGNFQPCSAAMERMWQERADYGHFFYRIPNGESAADAYDRVSGFNETMWRSFQEKDFPSVCVLVTHGLMTRVFLMRWYHWSVEYFEDLRNVNHCEFIIMKRARDSGKFILENQLRTWSELKKQAAKENGEEYHAPPRDEVSSTIANRQWGGCPEGCTHEHDRAVYAALPRRKHTVGPVFSAPVASKRPGANNEPPMSPTQGHPIVDSEEDEEAFPHLHVEDTSAPPSSGSVAQQYRSHSQRYRPSFAEAGRDFGGSASGAPTPAPGSEEARTDYGFPSPVFTHSEPRSSSDLPNSRTSFDEVLNRSLRPSREPSHRPSQAEETKWAQESGMGVGAPADALGDVRVQKPGMTLEEIKKREEADRSLRGSVY